MMGRGDYAVMSDQEVKQYFLDHRDDQKALEIYLDRLNTLPRSTITNVDDPDFDTKINDAILRQIANQDNR